jgi:hypothetical protein
MMEIFEMKRMAGEHEAEETNTIACKEVTGTPGTRPQAEAETEEKGWIDISSYALLYATTHGE